MRLSSFVSSAASMLAPLALFAGLAPSSYASAGNRITQTIPTNAAQVTVPNTIVARARRATDEGEAPADRALSSITLRFTMIDAQSAALDRLLAAQQNPASPQYHQWLTPEQFAAQFGMSASDLAKVSGWLQSQGLTVTGISRGGQFITANGTVAQVEKAFHTSIHTVTLDGEEHFTNVTDPALPAQLAAVTGSITGLNDFRPRPRIKPRFTSSISGSHFIAPGDFYTIYDTNPLLTSGVTGTGVTIAIMGQTDILQSDVSAFRAASGLSTTNLPTVMLYGKDPGTSAGDQPEASLDVEWSGAVAPNANILYVNSTDVVGVSLTQSIDNNIAPILSISYGNCESNFGASNIASYNLLFKQAIAQGQTIVGPAGDTGATDCDDNTTTPEMTAVDGLAVDFPASSPFVTGLGGSEFNEGSGNYWNSTNANFMGSALSYIPEMVWNDTALGGGLQGSGGGASVYFTKPAYQVGTGVPADFSRDVPDLTLAASPNHDGYLFCQGGFCTNGYRNAANNLDVVGGTSVSTPAFAGILALLEQKIGPRLGNVNPTIYGLANSTFYNNVFHDITVGNNAQPCTAGTPNCFNGGTEGFNATVGYDQATGWGSVDAFNMVNDWKLVTPTGVNSPIGSNLSATSVTATSTSVVSGTSVTLTVNVASATTGVTATPTGTINFLLDGTVTGSAVTLGAGSGSATFTLPTTGLASGSHVVQAAYSGDTNYNGSKGSVSINITSASTPDFTLSSSTTTTAANPGATSPGITFTVAPVNGFTGSVAFSATTNSQTLNATGSFSVNPVTILGTASGTTVFTLTASAPQALTGPGLIRHASAAPAPRPGAGKTASELAGSGFALAGLFLLAMPRQRRRRWTAWVILLAGLGAVSLSGCGSGNVSAGSTVLNAAAGTYPITITATSTSSSGVTTTHSTVINFVVN